LCEPVNLSELVIERLLLDEVYCLKLLVDTLDLIHCTTYNVDIVFLKKEECHVMRDVSMRNRT